MKKQNVTVTKSKGTCTLVNKGVTGSCCEASKFHVVTAHFSVRISSSVTPFCPRISLCLLFISTTNTSVYAIHIFRRCMHVLTMISVSYLNLHLSP